MQNGKVTSAILLDDGRVLIDQGDGTFTIAEGETDTVRLDAMTDAELTANAESDPDAPLADDDFWERDDLVVHHEPDKQKIHIAVDRPVINFFKRQGRGYQTRMNHVLRAYVASQKEAG